MKKPIPFGKYSLLERVNVGGMAEVFKAKAFGVEGFERLVAVKRILPSIAEDQEFITMFIDEAKIAVQLTHANVAQIFDLGKVNESYFIAMEYVHGKDLRAIFDRSRKRGETVPVPMACYCCMKTCEGLDYAHNKKDAAGRDLNLVHRDVSPQNVLISHDGETKIIDFGIAKATGKAGKTQAGILKGKFGYMSPEQVRGLPLDRRSDIFAVGIVLYELLTGERLFVGESDFSTLEKVRNVEIMPPSTYNRRIPEELEQIVLKALAKDVDERYQTAMDLHDDLQSFMYTSGNFFSRKDLSAYMRKAFADDIAKESQRAEEYRRMEADADASSGLDAFANLSPAKSAGTSGPPPPPPPKSRRRAPKRTMMGIGTAPAPGRTSRPPLPPRPSGPPKTSAPPPPPKSNGSAGAASTASASAKSSASGGGRSAEPSPGLDMDWDDEELSTQIYDKPGEGAIPALPDLEEPGERPLIASPKPIAVGKKSRQSQEAKAVPGTPSPFDQPSEAPPAVAPARDEPTGRATEKARPESTQLTNTEGKNNSSAMLGAIAVLLLAIFVGGVYVIFSPKVGRIHLATEPADAVVYLDRTPVPSSLRSPFVLQNVEPGSHLLEVRKHGFATWSTPIDVGSDQTVELPTVRLVPVIGTPRDPVDDVAATDPSTTPSNTGAAGTGFRLDTVPSGANVFVDDRRLDNSTPVTVSDLPPGAHTIRAELDNHAPWTGQIEIQAGQITQLPRTVLTLNRISVRFESEPSGAAVTLIRGTEERSVGETPTTSEIDTAGDSWGVRMTLRGHDAWSEPLTTAPGQSQHTVTATLVARSGGARAPRTPRAPRPAAAPTAAQTTAAQTTRTHTPTPPAVAPATRGTGTLMIGSRPASEVLIDGRSVGFTPRRSEVVSAGRHTITFVSERFHIRETMRVNVRAGETQRVIRTLTPGSE